MPLYDNYGDRGITQCQWIPRRDLQMWTTLQNNTKIPLNHPNIFTHKCFLYPSSSCVTCRPSRRSSTAVKFSLRLSWSTCTRRRPLTPELRSRSSPPPSPSCRSWWRMPVKVGNTLVAQYQQTLNDVYTEISLQMLPRSVLYNLKRVWNKGHSRPRHIQLKRCKH